MRKRLKGRNSYFPGSLYAMAFTLPILIIPLIFIAKKGELSGRTDPKVIFITLAFIVLYVIFIKPGKKIFEITENKFMSCGDFEKAHKKAIITEFIAFFGCILLIMFIFPMIL
jgi:hypothetical protein